MPPTFLYAHRPDYLQASESFADISSLRTDRWLKSGDRGGRSSTVENGVGLVGQMARQKLGCLSVACLESDLRL
jgi:hypothetical protein